MFASTATKKKSAELESKLALYDRAFAEIDRVCGRGAQGDIEARILDTESFGGLAPGLRSINRIFDLFDAFMRETSASLQYASEGKYFRPFLPRGMLGEFHRAATIVNTARKAMEARAHEAAAAEEARRESGGRIDRVNEAIVAISASMEQQGAATQEISKNVQEAALGARDVSQNIASVSAASGDVGEAAGRMKTSSAELATQADALRAEADRFVARVRAG